MARSIDADADSVERELHALGVERGESPSPDDVHENGHLRVSDVYAHYQTWNDALRAAGLPPLPLADTPDLLAADLAAFADRLGHAPSKVELREAGPHSPETYENVFGTWADALAAADLSVRPPVPDDALRADLRAVADERGEPVAPKGVRAHAHHNIDTFRDRWGSFAEACAAAGVDPDLEQAEKVRGKSDGELLGALRDLAEDLGRPPRTTEMRDDGPFSLRPYYDRWGDWGNALAAAGLDEENQ